MDKYLLLTICIAIVLFVGFLILCYFNSSVRKKAYKYFRLAEDNLSNGSEKMEYVLDNTYELIPPFIKLFISRSMYAKIIQKFFDEIHDLLDDGKLNKSN